MGKNQPKAAAHYFNELRTVRHWPSGLIFQQQGGRVYIINEETGEELDSMTSSELQEFPGKLLTVNGLRKLAVSWLEDNRPETLS